MDENAIKTHIKALPASPGIYMYKDAKGGILYVGKAKNLRSRVRSYFNKNANLGPTKEAMVAKIDTLETIATDTELEALVLEATLIRKHQPPFNVLLRDDKYYLFIKVTKDTPARIFPVRKIMRDNARYFGPYSSASSVRMTLKLLRRIFPFKEEKDRPRDIIFPHALFKENEQNVSFSPIGEKARMRADQEHDTALTPSLSQNWERGNTSAANVIRFLQGHRQEIMNTLKSGIADAVRDEKFEQAALFRDQLQAIERLEGSQKVYLPRNESFDVVSIAHTSTQSAGNILQIREGKLIGKQTFLLRHRTKTDEQDILRQFIVQYYSVAQDIPRTLYIPTPLRDQSILADWITKLSNTQHVTLAVPERGTKKQLLAMGALNANNLLREESVEKQTAQASKHALEELLKAINMQPHFALRATRGDSFRIETYDISNIQGTLATASMIVFENGMPAKNEYRKFKIRFNQDAAPTQHKSNDFAMLEEALTRRLARTDWNTPDLIIIDGGKGQLSSAMKALQKANATIPIISIAKQEEELFMPNRPVSVRIPYDSPALHLVQRMRDEAHRFTITYHRKLRSKEQTKSVLDEVPGIGPKTKKLLLKTFGSVKGITQASDTELEDLVGAKKTATLREFL